MTDPTEDRLTQAMRDHAAGFSAAGPPGETRTALVDRIRRRRRRMAASVPTALAVLAVVAVGVSLVGPGKPSAQRLATAGASRSTQTTIPADGNLPAIVPGPTPTTASISGGPSATTGSSRPEPTTRPSPSVPTTAAQTTPSTTVTSALSSVRGSVRFGPVCPVERIPPDPACAPRPGPAHIQLRQNDGTVASEGDAGADGQFVIDVAPGTYAVTAVATTPSAGAIGRACSVDPAKVTVARGARSTVAVSCDTGIR